MNCPLCKNTLYEDKRMPLYHVWLCPNNIMMGLYTFSHYITGNNQEDPEYFQRTLMTVPPYRIVVNHAHTSVFKFDNNLMTKTGLTLVLNLNKRITPDSQDKILSKIKTYTLFS